MSELFNAITQNTYTYASKQAKQEPSNCPNDKTVKDKPINNKPEHIEFSSETNQSEGIDA